MYITMESDYAIRIVCVLAREKRRVDANSISEISGVSLRFSLKILRKLVAAQIAKSFKGVKGGYELFKPAGEITLYDVIKTIEGDYYFSRCLDSNYVCQGEGSEECLARKIFSEISAETTKKLKSVTIDEIKDHHCH